MVERDEKRGGSGCAIGLVLVVSPLPVLYVLSIGPAAWMVNGNNPPRTFQAFYYPLAWLAEHSRPFQDALGRYMDLWT